MKTKILLIAISITTLLFFSSCEKDEMDKAGGAGDGGKENAYSSLDSIQPISLIDEKEVLIDYYLQKKSVHLDNTDYLLSLCKYRYII